MNDEENMNGTQISLSENELRKLKAKFNIDLAELKSLEEFQEASKETIKRIREIERKALNKVYPDREPIVPSGPECSFCFKAENEVKAMAKHGIRI